MVAGGGIERLVDLCLFFDVLHDVLVHLGVAMNMAPVDLFLLSDSLTPSLTDTGGAAATTTSMWVSAIDEPGRARGSASSGSVGWSSTRMCICGLNRRGGERSTLGICLQCLLKLCLR